MSSSQTSHEKCRRKSYTNDRTSFKQTKSVAVESVSIFTIYRHNLIKCQASHTFVYMVAMNYALVEKHSIILHQARSKRSGRSGLGSSTFCQPLIFTQQIVPSMRRTSVLYKRARPLYITAGHQRRLRTSHRENLRNAI